MMQPALATPDTTGVHHVLETALSDTPGVRLIDGPLAALPGFVASDVPGNVSLQLDRSLGEVGSVSFWFRAPRSYVSGRTLPPRQQPLVVMPGGVAVSFVAEKSSVSLLVLWEGAQVDADRNIRIILPEFPGEEWHHFALTWDAGQQTINVFLDGTPYYALFGKPVTGSFPILDRLVVHFSDFALAGMRAVPQALSPAEAQEMAGPGMIGRLDALLGWRKLADFDCSDVRGDLIYSSALGHPEEIRKWVLEGPGEITFEEGWMRMKSSLPNGPQGHLVHWLPLDVPDRFLAEWEFELMQEKGLCIVFFAARGSGDRDLFDPALARRTGVFEQYINGDIDCYHISYFAHTPNEPRPMTNLRKNHGFYLLSNGPGGIAAEARSSVHRAALLVDGARIRMSVNGRTVIDYTDDGERAGPVWRGGKIGLRQMQWTDGRYRNLRISHLIR